MVKFILVTGGKIKTEIKASVGGIERIRTVEGGVRIPLNVVSTGEFGGKQQVVVYESPGTNGGTVLTTGRTNNNITLSGRILLPFKNDWQRANPMLAFPNPIYNLNYIKSVIQRLRDAGEPVQLVSPIDNDDSGSYIIESFTCNVVEGVESYLPFTMTLQEYRQANIQASSQNLVSFEPGQKFVKRLQDLNILGTPITQK